MRIQNKFSRRRWDKKMKWKIQHMKFLRRLQKKFPNNQYLSGLEIPLLNPEFDFSNIDLGLEHINIFEIITNENLSSSINSILKMFKKNKPKKYLIPANRDKIKEKLKNIVSTSSVKSWSKLGYIHFTNNKIINEYVKFIEVSIITISGSFSILSFDVSLNDTVNEEMQKLILNNIDSLSYKGRIRLFEILKVKKILAGGRISNEATKAIIIEDIITELKYQCLKEISRYIKLFFTENDICAPSLNAFSTNINHNNKSHVAEHIWCSLKIPRYGGDFRKNGDWAIFLNRESTRQAVRYNNYTLIFDNNYCDELHKNYRYYIDFIISHIGYQYFYVFVYNTYINYYEKILTSNRNFFHETIRNGNDNLSSWLKLKMQIDKKDIMFNRIYESKGDSYYTILMDQERDGYVKFNSNMRARINLDNYWESIKKQYDDMEENRMRLAEDVKLYVQSITTKNSIRYNSKSILLMLISVFISLISVIIGLISILVATESISF